MISYKKYQNKNEKNVTTFNKWYARAVQDRTVEFEDFVPYARKR